MRIMTRLLSVSSTDPDDARRRQLLSILLLGLMLIASVGLIALTTASLFGTNGTQDMPRLFYAFGGALLGFVLLFLINRYVSGVLAGALFVIFLTIVIGLSDTPEQVVEGRTLFLFAIPILVSSVVLPSWASFVAAVFCSVVISFLGMSIRPGYVPPFPSMFGFFAIALVSWIAARSLEQALNEVREINRNLDRLVEERTRELAEALSENRAVLNSIADGVIVFNTDGRAAVANPAITALLSRPADTLIGRTLDALMGQDVAAEDRALMLRLLRGDSTIAPTFKLEWGRKTLSVSCAPVWVESGQISGTVTVFRDFTREAELDRMKSAFVSMVSHELRTPLNAVLGYADMLKENVYGVLNDQQSEVMQRIIANTNRQLSLVNDLLDRAQIEAGTLSFNYNPLNPADLMRDMHATMIVLASAKGLMLDCRLAPDLPATVFGDAQRLHQILINLVNNAIKFTDRGMITVEMFAANGGMWGVRVTDTGSGIPDDAYEYIFEPFRRVDGLVTRKHSGAGLGLSIVKQLVELMGGSINLSSQLGSGSVFTLMLPIEPAQNAVVPLLSVVEK